ncbi:MAG: RNA polymerase sigma factor (sigma-70 family) [Granulosicoccus sp.]|jgi:RNA polymerase sigma factor (sigma-70 family)
MADTKSSKSRFGILTEFKNSQLSLRNFISRYVVSPHDIDDVSQETFLRAYKAEQEKEIEHPKAFLFRIAKNLMLSEFSRKAKKITSYIEDYDNSEDFLNSANLEQDILAQQKLGIYCEAVASLPPQCRRVVVMKKVYGMKNKEIASRLELSVSTVEKHLSKGIRQSNAIFVQRYGDTDSKISSTKAGNGGTKS